jgi:acetylornithine deacetylase
MSKDTFGPADGALLLHLLRIPTASPLETGRAPAIAEAQAIYADAAVRIGFEVIHHEPPPPSTIEGGGVPLTVRECAARMGPAFFESQPNLVLRLGPSRPPARTLAFNFHADTVGGDVPVGLHGGRITGRGAADMKGPGVAVLAGVREALRRDPDLTKRISLLVQCPAGEEGGAMGVHGTRHLFERGFYGALNVFVEPSAGVYFDRATCTMTARVEVAGQGSTDDEPAAGHNATVLLGFLAQHLCWELAGPIERGGGKLCVAGLHTGEMHNRVYGDGRLLLNFAYGSAELARQIEAWTEASLARGIAEFAARFDALALTRRTAQEARETCRLTWLKRGLPALANRDERMERLLEHAGWRRNPDDRPDRCFTCDAIWGQGPDRYSVVFGPGSLGANGCHTPDEFIDVGDLRDFAVQVADLICAFANEVGAAPESEVNDARVY